MAESNTTSKTVAEVEVMGISVVSIDCPHCEATQEGWLADPRHGEHTCRDCGGVYRVPIDMKLAF